MTMEHLKTLADVFSRRMFRVPDYQRGYAWDKEQREDLLQDLELLPDGKLHYTGTLILSSPPDGITRNRMDKGRTEYSVADIVDGQQRITTLVLLLEMIRRKLEQLAQAEWAERVLRDYIMVEDANNQPMLRLALNSDCHDYFRSLLCRTNVSGPKIRSHKLLKEAGEQFEQYLRQKKDELKGDFLPWLESFYIKITQRLTFLIFEASDESDAGVIFETMNDRGKPLTELEKVKNYLLYLCSKLDLKTTSDLPQRIVQTWAQIFERLMAADLGHVENENQLLRAHWLMAYDPDPKKWQGSRSIKERLSLKNYQDRHQALLHDLIRYVDTLREAATAYCDIQNPMHSDAFRVFDSTPDGLRSKVKHANEKLVRLGSVAAFLPLLMAVRLKCANDGGKSYLRMVELCEKYAFRVYSWLNKRADTGQASLFRLGHKVFHDERNFVPALDEVRELLLHYCPDRQFEAEFDLETERNWYQWSDLRYFLYEYEEYLAIEAGIGRPRMSWEKLQRRVNTKKDTIEHILPQNPDAGGYWTQRFSPEDRKKYTNDIGNLSLTYYNPSLGNRSFPEKKGQPGQARCYAGSIILIEQRLAKYDDWTAQEILARREEIKEWALERWRVKAPPQPESTKTDVSDPSRNKLDALIAEADGYGVGESFRRILEVAEKHRIHPIAREKSVVLPPPPKRTYSLITLAPKRDGFRVAIRSDGFTKFYRVTTEDVVAALGPIGERNVTPDEVKVLAERLDRFMTEITEAKKT